MKFAFLGALLSLISVQGFLIPSQKSIAKTVKLYSASTQAPPSTISTSSSSWDGKSIPEENPERFDLKVDASFDRRDTRPLDFIDNDQANPPGQWWTAYLPSKQEQEAAEQGFDFKDGEQWLKDKAEGKIEDLDTDKVATEFKYKFSFFHNDV